jgi:DNA-binding CsgD family transcriptional regulator
MIVISPACPDDRITIRANIMGNVIRSIGTDRYGSACLDLFGQSLDAEHWALFHYRADNSVSCVATASSVHAAAALENIDRFVLRCHRVDPSLIALKQQHRDRTSATRTCVTKMNIEDIQDRQYRHCFEATQVQERISFFSRLGDDLHQLCVYRGPRRRGFSSLELAQFSSLAGLVLATAFKHDKLCRGAAGFPGPMDIEAIDRCLECLPGGLSKREREVCSRAAAGKTIEGTALDLNIRKTSVVTYRQRAYQKLGISRLTELVALVNNLRSNGVSGHA